MAIVAVDDSSLQQHVTTGSQKLGFVVGGHLAGSKSAFVERAA